MTWSIPKGSLADFPLYWSEVSVPIGATASPDSPPHANRMTFAIGTGASSTGFARWALWATPPRPLNRKHAAAWGHRKWSSKAEFVTIWVGQVKKPFPPIGIAWRRFRTIAGRDHARVQGVNVGMVKDHPPPPRPSSLGGLGDEIEVAASSPKARERARLTAVNNFKSEHTIEADGARHIVRRQRDGADALDHRGIAHRRSACASRKLDVPTPTPSVPEHPNLLLE